MTTLESDVPSTKKRKRGSIIYNNNRNNDETPNKKRKTSCAVTLHSIDEKCAMQSNTKVSGTNTVLKNDKKKATNYQLPLRRSPRFKNKQNNHNCTISNKSTSAPLSKLKPKPNNKQNKNNNNDWSDILSESIKTKYNAAATPFKSSLKERNKTFSRMKEWRKVNWGTVECRKYEQRCGILSSGVPSVYGPSLHLGKLISQTTGNIDEYGHTNTNYYYQLSTKERIKRVKQFCCSDVNKQKLKQDMNEIKLLKESRIDIGCKCKSIYKMKKNELIDSIWCLDKTMEKKALHRLKKENVFSLLTKLQFAKYGRYDVCCIGEECYCFQQGIECQIDDDCCQCGGNVIYNNNEGKLKSGYERRKDKMDSLGCANPNGNTLNVSVLDYVDKNKNKSEILKTVESPFLEFTSPFVQKRIKEWKKHYDNEEKDECSQENKDKVQKVLRFD